MANFLLKFWNFRYHGNRGWCDTNFVCIVIACVCVVGTDYAEQCALPEMSDQADESDFSNPDSCLLYTSPSPRD